MKSLQNLSSHSKYTPGFSFSSNHKRTPKQKPATGSLTGRYPVVLNDGRTVIYITDRSKESEVRARYNPQ
jgi:hypothetical protein